MSIGRQIIDRCAADHGRDMYSQPRRTQLGYSDCSSYLRRVFGEVAGLDIGSYTTAIAGNAAGRVVTTSPADVLAGRWQDGDVILWGWSTDHRRGYPYSHVGVLTHDHGGGSWDQYGDVAPFVRGSDGRNHGHGPNFHALDWGTSRADRVKVMRFLPDETAPQIPTAPPLRDDTPLLGVDGSFGPRTITRLQQMLGVTADGIYGPQTKRALQRWLGVTVDGVVGPRTIRALQDRVGATVDGDWGPDTTRHLQHYLNIH